MIEGAGGVEVPKALFYCHPKLFDIIIEDRICKSCPDRAKGRRPAAAEDSITREMTCIQTRSRY